MSQLLAWRNRRVEIIRDLILNSYQRTDSFLPVLETLSLLMLGDVVHCLKYAFVFTQNIFHNTLFYHSISYKPTVLKCAILSLKQMDKIV
jgi:hypothetical protein